MTCKILFFDLEDCERYFFEDCQFNNFDIKFFQCRLDERTINRLEPEDFQERMMICVNDKSKITSDIISKFKNLRLISTRGANYKHIDLPACADNNIAVINVEDDNETCEDILKKAFAGMTSYLCGGKDFRIL